MTGESRPATASADRRSAPLAIVGVVGWVGLLWLGATLYAATPPKAGFDLELLLRAGRDVAAGRSPYDPALVAGSAPVAESLFYSYPPVVAQADGPRRADPVAGDVRRVGRRRRRRSRRRRRGARPAVRAGPPDRIGRRPGRRPRPARASRSRSGCCSATSTCSSRSCTGAMLLAVSPGRPARRGDRAAASPSPRLQSRSSTRRRSVSGSVSASLGGGPASLRVLVVAIVVGARVLAVSLIVCGHRAVAATTSRWSAPAATRTSSTSANAGPAAQLALLLGQEDRFARTAQIGVTAVVLVVTILAARRVAATRSRASRGRPRPRWRRCR